MIATIESPQQTSFTAAELPLTDEDLLIRYRTSGDRGVFAQLVKRYERELYNYLRRYLGDAEQAEDVFQSTFLQVHLKCDQFEVGRKFRPWLYTIATNQAIDAQRRNRRHRLVSLDRAGREDSDDIGGLIDLLVSDVPNPEEGARQSEDREWVETAMGELSDQMRTVVSLVYYQGLKYREAADIMSIPVGTVKSRLHSAILKLTAIWNNTHVEQL
ncbi:MAG: RNA polymerase sigma-70 factor (ECF subfamily) [Pirellulaceae bacterium]|jgi:RNA polymerase sigma-70 factor (ECF subfamily)